MKRIWIMDGHNMIFAIQPLQQLQVSDRRDDARQGLADRLERFALARDEKVLVVFDGNAMPSNPDVVRKPLFETAYTRRGEGVADDRIIREARRYLEQGHPVTVVTNDVTTLAAHLPQGAHHLKVQAFWLKHIEKEVGEDGKQVEGDFSDLEREMMEQAALAEAGPRGYGPEPAPGAGGLRGAGALGPPSRTGERAAASSAAGTRRFASDEEVMRERLRRKRERGRVRQERRLARRPRPGRRR